MKLLLIDMETKPWKPLDQRPNARRVLIWVSFVCFIVGYRMSGIHVHPGCAFLAIMFAVIAAGVVLEEIRAYRREMPYTPASHVDKETRPAPPHPE